MNSKCVVMYAYVLLSVAGMNRLIEFDFEKRNMI